MFPLSSILLYARGRQVLLLIISLLSITLLDLAATPPRLLLKQDWALESHNNSLIVYAYSPGEYRTPNLEFFVRKGGIINSTNYQYVFISSGPSWDELNITQEIKRYSNVEFMEKENYGFDACAWKDVLAKYAQYYRRFILLNGSIRGPFLPNYVDQMQWPELFLKPLESNDVGLSGITFNCYKTHIQSMLMAFNRNTFDIIYNTLECYQDKEDLIKKGEIAYSSNVLKAGYNLHVMEKYFQRHDFRDTKQTQKKCKDLPGDTVFPNHYFGMNYHPFELIFMKTNRGITPDVIERYSDWTLEGFFNDENGMY